MKALTNCFESFYRMGLKQLNKENLYVDENVNLNLNLSFANEINQDT